MKLTKILSLLAEYSGLTIGKKKLVVRVDDNSMESLKFLELNNLQENKTILVNIKIYEI